VDVIVLFLVLLAIVCYLMAAAGYTYPRYHLGWVGNALVVVAFLLSNVFLFKVNT
jgi:hypothetical protein